MIATHNVKVNGKWYHAGDEYTLEDAAAPVAEESVTLVAEEPVEQDIPAPEPVIEAEVKEEPKSEPKAEPKPRSTTRRKKISE